MEIPGSESDLNSIAARAGKLVRAKLGVELNAAEESRVDTSLSANSEALKYFSEGREKLKDFDVLSAIKLLDKSLAVDLNFVQARTALSEAWFDLGYESKASDEAKAALDISSKVIAAKAGERGA